MNKVCNKCEISKPLEGFAKNRQAKDGLCTWCKDCSNANRKKLYYSKHAYELERKHTEYYREQHRTRGKDVFRFSAHGITKSDYLELLHSQGNKCATCDKAPEDLLRLTIDHDHACCPGVWSCGKCVRGVVCNSCNVKIGFIERGKSEMTKPAFVYLLSAKLGKHLQNL